MKRTWVDLLLILAVGTVMFAHVSTAYFCGYDDFGEMYRAAFEDAQQPSLIFTTTHFGTTKYRPLNRLATYLCWRMGDGSPLPFRLRNLLFHLLCSLMVYGLALVLTRERSVALASGLLFCLDPVANQNVVAAIFTNTAANACLLGGLLLFAVWMRSKRRYLLASAILLIFVGMFFYEPVIVAFPIMAALLLLEKLRGRVLNRSSLWHWAAGSSLAVLLFAWIRHSVVRGKSPLVPVGMMLHNAMVYSIGLLSPVDAVSSHQFFGTPLPPVLHIKFGTGFFVALSLAAMFVVLLVLYLRRPAVRESVRKIDAPFVLLLAALIPVALSPFLVFTPHASETYLYLPAAIYAILLTYLLWRLIPWRSAYWAVVCVLLVSFSVGTWIRNQRVFACGQAAHNILTSLPITKWHTGDWSIHLFSAPGQDPPPRYGIYNYRGIATIGPADPNTGHGAQHALQLATRNPALKADVDVREPMPSCILPETCFEVFLDGSVRAVARPDQGPMRVN
ncbi:MAG TPA: hypothetical protein VFW94_06435 [Candidatus Acidoferrales bacterium]|nr:hypothetical protein [Candidatus Acidoferrales bacterium]